MRPAPRPHPFPLAALLTMLAMAALTAPGAVRAGEPSAAEVLARARRAEFSRPWRKSHAESTPASAPQTAFERAHQMRSTTTAFPPANVRINDPAGDSAGVAQVAPSVAALGANVLCAFTDGEGLVHPVGGVGFAWSADGGASYTDGGAPPSPPGWIWSASPVLAVDSSSGMFYLAACADSNTAVSAQSWNALITISASFPGAGAPMWGAPRIAARTASAAGLFDQPYLAANPLTHALDLVCVRYTATGSGIEFRASGDQGANWSAPVTLSEPFENGAVAGPRVVDLPAPLSRVTVAWLSAGAIDADAYRVRSSADGGLSWGSAVSPIFAFHAFGSAPPGSNRGASADFPALAVDVGPASPHRGRLYLAWQESVNFYGDTLYFSPPQAAPPVRESEPDDDVAHATPFALGQTLRGNLSGGDQDWFAFSGSQGQTVVVLVDSLDASLDCALRLTCSDGATRLAYSAPGPGVGYGGEIVFTLPEAGTYFVRLAAAPGSVGNGGYRVRTALHHPVAGRARDHRDIFASHSDDGVSWSTPVLLSDDPPWFDDALPELAVDGNGVAYAEWLDWRDAPAGSCGGVSRTYLARSANGGDVFTSFGALSDAATAWSSVASNLANSQGDHLGLFASDTGVYPAWADGRGGDPDIEGVTLSLGYLATPTLISLLSVSADPTHVALRWYEAGGIASATLERRIEPGEWDAIATLVPDGGGYLSYDDRGVPPGSVAHYRLAPFGSPDGPYFGSADVRMPGTALFALSGAWPNPITRAARVRFSLDSSAPAELEMIDASGRRVAFAEVGALGAGAHVVELAPGGSLAPGLYLIRLHQGARSKVARAALIR